MPHKKTKPSEYIKPLYMNGLSGRMLYLPAPKNKTREILGVYGHYSTLERWLGVAQDLNQYGSVTMPDLPGFGGMEGFYKIGAKPSIDNLADYLAAFVKLRYRRKKITLVGLSFGFVVITRMLQRYPILTNKVDVVISIGGFTHREDFKLSRSQHASYGYLTKLFSRGLPALFFRNVFLHPGLIQLTSSRSVGQDSKGTALSKVDRRRLTRFKSHLWHRNDLRTFMYTMNEVLRLNNCDRPVGVSVVHVQIKSDERFDTSLLEQHLWVIFKDCKVFKVSQHAPFPLLASSPQRHSYVSGKLAKLLSV